jgi:hypothetical protein
MAAIAAAVAGGVAIAGSAIAANQAHQAAKGFANEADRKAWEIANLEAHNTKSLCKCKRS